MGDTYYGYAWNPGSVRVAEHNSYVPEGRTHTLRTSDFTDTVKVAHIRVLWPMIQGLDPVRIGDLAQNWRKLSAQLTTARSNLGRNGNLLEPRWTGEASRAFMERVGAALYSLDQWIEAATTNAATIDRLATDIRTTQPKVERIYNDWLTESANEKFKRDKDAERITLAQDADDLIGFLSKHDVIRDRGVLYRWARDSVPQDEIDQKYTALALPLVKNLADHFSNAAATGISLPGKFQGPTTFRVVQPQFGGAPPAVPTLPGAVLPVQPGVRPPALPPTPPGVAPPAPPAPVAPAVPGVPPAAPGVRPPAAPAVGARPSAVPRPLLPPPPSTRTAPTRPTLPTLAGRRGGAPGVPGVPAARQPGPTRRGLGPGTPALPGRTGTPNTGRKAPTAPPAVPAHGARSGLDGRTGRAGRPVPAPSRPVSPAPPQLAGRSGPPPTRRTPVSAEPPEFRRAQTTTSPVDAEPQTKPSLGGRRGPERTAATDTSDRGRTARPELTGRTGRQGVSTPDTRPAVESQRHAGPPPDEAFAPTESAPAVIERPEAQTAVQPGPALGRATTGPRSDPPRSAWT
ncbi:WXG100 family type VII secretion target [Cryptosporangium aurantiacum]|uniref:Outer membrane channel protein CpnT-like N-terminal domain-containing protein n=1 Tax=Cryptosporangium aurantiacum TaxID=134849 RepID=A0A1M7NIC3_9ACTN|nr:hypothetical protein [Cryptosporangium aurantiacum]SHN03429.1 hypothetical protein SAMN05443668_102646 [Cryptosporangium aurantiacum]